LTPNSGIKK